MLQHFLNRLKLAGLAKSRQLNMVPKSVKVTITCTLYAFELKQGV